MPPMPRRVLIVDDVKSIRAMVRQSLEPDPQIEVVGEAADAFEARELLKALKPDVMTLDIEMPQMNGDIFLKQVMALRPLPVIMLSQKTKPGNPAAVAALADGAVDCIEKPNRAADLLNGSFSERLRASVRAANLPFPVPARGPVAGHQREFHWNGRYVVIGASTGGVAALLAVLSRFRSKCPPTVVAQHMPANFIRGLVDLLDNQLSARVVLGRHGLPLIPGQIVIAPGGQMDTTIKPGSPPHLDLIAHDDALPFCPSIDLLFGSAATFGARSVGAILTGMGRDGADGMLAMHVKGGATIVQDEETCVVYGMPRAAMALGGAAEQLAIERIGERLVDLCCSRTEGSVQ